ncbi:MAG: wax ester/triacylglycerol synthase family O-acyltransferase [Actinobacteria bacterium]|nr:wax ester/triacylglycerol synthase family O-acyltransferase [Actinomycetota bacterium]
MAGSARGERLSSFDTSFLTNERGGAHMAIGAVLMFAGAVPDEADLVTHIGARLHQVPRLRQRLHRPPLDLGTPYWVADPDFELRRHVHFVRLPAPGTEEQFRELVSRLLEPPLARDRPLWELHVVGGFEDERFAIVYRTHHAMADGISAVDIGMLLFDVEPRAEPDRHQEPWRAPPVPGPAVLLGGAVRGLFATCGRLGRWVRRALARPGRAWRSAVDGLVGVWEVTLNLARPAPAVPLNVAIGGRRRFDWVTADLAELKRVKEAAGATVNDVSLAIATGALRRLLVEQGVEVEGVELKALVPVSIRAFDEHGELGNRLTAMRGPLPVGVADPLERVRVIAAAMDALKGSKQSLGAEAIWGLNDWFRDFAPPLLLNPTAAINFSPRLFNLLVTNFPGPQFPFYVLGRELTHIHPLGFLARRHAVAIAILSYNGEVSFGVLVEPDAGIELRSLVEHVEAAVAELSAAVPLAPARG